MNDQLRPPDPAIYGAIAQHLHGRLPRRLRGVVDEYLNREHGSIGQNVLESFYESQILYLYEAMLDWMGSGGDEFFLSMYLVSNGALPPIDSGGLNDRELDMGGTLPSLFKIADKTLHIWQEDGLDRVKLRANHDQGYPWTTIALPRIDFVFCDKSAGDKENPWHDWVFHSLTWYIYPSPTYRRDLMGELATPWEVFEGHMPFYRPQRHLLPEARAYDDFGVMPRWDERG